MTFDIPENTARREVSGGKYGKSGFRPVAQRNHRYLPFISKVIFRKFPWCLKPDENEVQIEREQPSEKLFKQINQSNLGYSRLQIFSAIRAKFFLGNDLPSDVPGGNRTIRAALGGRQYTRLGMIAEEFSLKLRAYHDGRGGELSELKY
jgi:hypothetical protein